MIQLIGVAAFGIMVFALSSIVRLALKATIGILVSPSDELEGLDVGEHGMEAYAGFVEQDVRTEVI